MKSMRRIRAGIVTISDSCAAGKRNDESGNYLKKKLKFVGWPVASYKVVPDDRKMIAETLVELCDRKKLDVVLTTGGTGLSKRDVTPEATRDVIEKEIPGLSEAMRIQTFRNTRFSILSRGISGYRGKTLIINLPGSVNAVRECSGIILPVIPHALEILKGKTHHGKN